MGRQTYTVIKERRAENQNANPASLLNLQPLADLESVYNSQNALALQNLYIHPEKYTSEEECYVYSVYDPKRKFCLRNFRGMGTPKPLFF